MGLRSLPVWARSSAAFTLGGIAVSLAHYYSSGPAGRLDVVVYVSFALACGWSGAGVGGAADWFVNGRSPLAPMFEGRFGWYYRKRYWQRFAMTFAGAWVAFILATVAGAAGFGEYGDVQGFLTPEGVSAVLLFVGVFGLEGALVGGLLDAAVFIFRKKG